MYEQTNSPAHTESYTHTQRYRLVSVLPSSSTLGWKSFLWQNWARGSSKVNLLKLEVSVKVLFSGASQTGQSLSIGAANRGQETGDSGLTAYGKHEAHDFNPDKNITQAWAENIFSTFQVVKWVSTCPYCIPLKTIWVQCFFFFDGKPQCNLHG